MASGPITSWEIEGETVETVSDFLFLGAPKSLQMVTAAMKWLTKVHIVKGMAFPVVLYRGKNWTMKKFEHQRTDAFELWCSRRLLRVPWTAERSA